MRKISLILLLFIAMCVSSFAVNYPGFSNFKLFILMGTGKY